MKIKHGHGLPRSAVAPVTRAALFPISECNNVDGCSSYLIEANAVWLTKNIAFTGFMSFVSSSPRMLLRPASRKSPMSMDDGEQAREYPIAYHSTTVRMHAATASMIMDSSDFFRTRPQFRQLNKLAEDSCWRMDEPNCRHRKHGKHHHAQTPSIVT